VNRRDRFPLAVLVVLAVLWSSTIPARSQEPEPSFRITAERWAEAERLFRTDPHWLGGDGASSVDLGKGRILWLFGDSFIDSTGARSRRSASIVRNSVAIQNGYEPETARMTFSWKILGNRPRSFFREDGIEWFWPGSGIRMGDVLLVFLVKVCRADNALGFEPSGWKAVLIPNPDSPPSLWGMKYPEIPRTGRVLVGSASVLVLDGYLYAFGSDGRGQAVHAVRWQLADAAGGRLTSPEWWMGPGRGWVRAMPPNAEPVPVFTGGQVEFTIHYEPDLKGFIQVQTLSLADPCLAVRFARGLGQPWSPPECFYQPPERSARGLLIYAGKAHKVLAGAEIAFTYAVNTTGMERLMNDMDIYYPVVLKGAFILDPQGEPREETPVGEPE